MLLVVAGGHVRFQVDDSLELPRLLPFCLSLELVSSFGVFADRLALLLEFSGCNCLGRTRRASGKEAANREKGRQVVD